MSLLLLFRPNSEELSAVRRRKKVEAKPDPIFLELLPLRERLVRHALSVEWETLSALPLHISHTANIAATISPSRLRLSAPAALLQPTDNITLSLSSARMRIATGEVSQARNYNEDLDEEIAIAIALAIAVWKSRNRRKR